MDNLNLNSKEAYKKLEEASNAWSEWHKKVIVLDEGRKATFSKCVLKHKKIVKTMSEAEHEARTDQEYKDVVQHYAEAEEQLIKAKFHYQNLDRYLSVRQTEIKRDLALVSKQEG
tara:strand:+ start:3470 stop:3814 length:345 start_codon:yes stop_codon:yes gene_type:complete